MATDEALAAIEPYAAFLHRTQIEIASDLDRYIALLRKWQSTQNLVSRETLPRVWTRHIADSLQVLRHLHPDDRRFVDLGSGGGLPAIPLAVARKGVSGLCFTLVEANSRKAAFLRSVARELELPLVVEATRIEEIDSRETSPADVITSRALAPLPELLSLAAPLFAAETRAIFHKGREFGEELAETRALWDFAMLVFPSDTSSDGVLLEISNLRLVPRH
jgi:16S rRNA (guanine527-N7)-methyltransferase